MGYNGSALSSLAIEMKKGAILFGRGSSTVGIKMVPELP